MEEVFTQDSAENMLDMRWGHPLYMQSCWHHSETFHIHLRENLRYPTPDDKTTQKLEAKLREVHKKYKNADTEGKEFVLGNGAMQVILAALYSIQKLEDKWLNVYAQPPYWARFKLLTEIASKQLHWSDRDSYCDTIKIIATPNNPDNKIKSSMNIAEHVITDLCYNWPQYTDQINHNDDIMVFGLSKMTGHAGSRIGWAWVRDEKLAKLMRQYIEVTVGGVSLDSQMKTLAILTSMDYTTHPFKDAEKILKRRWNRFRAVSLCLISEYEMINQDGMFIWCKAKNGDGVETFKRLAQTLGVSGEGFGVDKSYVRINLGCDEDQFGMFIDNLWKNLTSKDESYIITGKGNE